VTEPVVEVQDLRTSIGDTTLVDGVSFALTGGRVVALVGESGSGKTTTGLALLGESPSGATVTGAITVAGAQVDPDTPPRHGVVGYIPQHPSSVLNPVRRVGSVLREMALRHMENVPDTRRERRRAVHECVLEALRRAQLSEGETLLRRYPHQLSGGQQQRIVLAQALVCRPKVVVADEPTTGQDVLTRQQIIEELDSVTEQGIAVLLLTHDLDMVRALADHVLVSRTGRIVETGAPAAVFADPRHEYTRRLVAAQLDVPAQSGEPPGAEPLLAVHEMTAGHRGRNGWADTLRSVSLDVHRADRVALVGRSGSGKTTLARCIAGLHAPRSGDVRMEGCRLAALARKRARRDLARIQYVFQDARASFNEFVPVIDQVARTAERLRGASAASARERALDTLRRAGLDEATTTRLPASLSGGELQRSALARALLGEPDVLICDEITSGLDTVTQSAILDLLRDLQRDTRCALVVITHDLGVVAGLTDRIVVLDDGRIVEEGPTDDVLDAPRHALTRALVAATTPTLS
jgi:peptide/nickel transport system ATP-binding protein